MKRFENAQVGDLVYSMIHGDCVISGKGEECLYLKSKEKDFIDIIYHLSGHFFYNIGEPILFYRKGNEKYLTERPEPEIDWFKVPMGTKVVTADHPIINNNNDYIEFFMGYFPELDDPFWTFNDMHRDSAAGFKHCKLAEPWKPEWIKK